ncbi:pantoate--beta-alanine ligase [Nocardioides aequoreus]|uniref:pantoate--beta-alanine ligase n=1 Tax=Nocardioides aequoreus TaxID=397278 RepID=UPI0004C4282D|nr:pantoate--beta-alanine ligase [Nocardioides aequoreus]
MTAPLVVGSRAELDATLPGGRLLVPTMGALHEGHASLLRLARAHGDGPLVASVFVNPMQFAPGEDLERYPRTFEADLALCAREGVDVVFAPDVEEVYPGGDPQVTVDPGPLGAELEGASRPTHFRGVLTVVAKLLGLVRPEVAVFGEKDYQQLTLVRRMVDDLCLGVRVAGAPTVRDPDGLALSSRNRYLSPREREQALALSRALDAARRTGAVEAAEKVLADADGVAVDYLALRGPDLGPAPVAGPARLLVAARVGTTRLIDNVALDLGAGSEGP